jgi:hypothetical protein
MKEKTPFADAANFFLDVKLAGEPLQCDKDDGTCDEMRYVTLLQHSKAAAGWEAQTADRQGRDSMGQAPTELGTEQAQVLAGRRWQRVEVSDASYLKREGQGGKAVFAIPASLQTDE